MTPRSFFYERTKSDRVSLLGLDRFRPSKLL